MKSRDLNAPTQGILARPLCEANGQAIRVLGGAAPLRTLASFSALTLQEPWPGRRMPTALIPFFPCAFVCIGG